MASESCPPETAASSPSGCAGTAEPGAGAEGSAGEKMGAMGAGGSAAGTWVVTTSVVSLFSSHSVNGTPSSSRTNASTDTGRMGPGLPGTLNMSGASVTTVASSKSSSSDGGPPSSTLSRLWVDSGRNSRASINTPWSSSAVPTWDPGPPRSKVCFWAARARACSTTWRTRLTVKFGA